MWNRINTPLFYKPLYLKDLDCSELIKRKFIFLKTNKSIPNLLVSGPPGSGKSTASKLNVFFFWVKFKPKVNLHENLYQLMFLQEKFSGWSTKI